MALIAFLAVFSGCRDPELPPLALSQWRQIEARSQADSLISQILSMEREEYREHRQTLIEIATSPHHMIDTSKPWSPEYAVAWMQDNTIRAMQHFIDSDALRLVAYSQPGEAPEDCDMDRHPGERPVHCVAWNSFSYTCKLYDPERDLVILPEDPACVFLHPEFKPHKPHKPEIYQKVPGGWEANNPAP
ncbi:MAG: hypothetical protein P8R54_01070 [Myxococcota bacterium]|nr:hypothetical protein [Myxococcota bacterium]